MRIRGYGVYLRTWRLKLSTDARLFNEKLESLYDAVV